MDSRKTCEKNIWIHEIPTNKYLDPQIPTRKKYAPTKYLLDNYISPQNTAEENLRTHKKATKKDLDWRNTYVKKFWTHKIPTRIIITDPQNIQKKNIWIHEITTKKILTHEISAKPWWHNDTRLTRPTMTHDPLNLSHSVLG